MLHLTNFSEVAMGTVRWNGEVESETFVHLCLLCCNKADAGGKLRASSGDTKKDISHGVIAVFFVIAFSV